MKKFESKIYSGWVRHRRFLPVGHAFQYSLSMMYLDLDELDDVFRGRWFWSARGFNLAWFKRGDYMRGRGPAEQPLTETVRELVLERCGSRPEGPIRVLTQVRKFGYGMNPVSFYYCFQRDGVTLHSIIAEITNTPWGEQFSYVLPATPGEFAVVQRSENKSAPYQPEIEILRTCGPKVHRFQFEKTFHVSPFMGMDFQYDWRFSVPGETLAVHMLNLKTEHNVSGAGGTNSSISHFDATMVLKRRELTAGALSGDLLMHPLATIKIVAAIYFHAARLWLKRVPGHSHPKGLSQAPEKNAAP